MARGRKTVPLEVKQQNGTVNITRESERPQILSSDEYLLQVPNPPDNFNEYNLREWDLAWDYLQKFPMVFPVDLTFIIAFCVEMGKYHECNDKLLKEGMTVVNRFGDEVENPLLNIADKALKNALRIAAEFGFTPSTRAKFKMPIKTPKQKLDSILNG